MTASEPVFLRHLEAEDAIALWELRVRDREFFAPYEPEHTDADFSLDTVRVRISQDSTDRRTGLTHSFGIFLRDTDELVGQLRLTSIFRGPWQNANVGYFIAQEHNGRGYATSAVRQAVRFAFSEIGLHRLQAGVMIDNVRSTRVLEKAGFRREGVALRYLRINGAWRDHVIFAITVEDWEQQ